MFNTDLTDSSNIFIRRTEQTKKISIGGKTELYPVYEIQLDALYYNDKNDRIATWISKYKAENSLNSFESLSKDIYNEIIEDFIIDSNKEAIDKTKNNIKLIGQQEPGVVLSDGRIIDGNRRFTCLRLLHKENINNKNYFEAIILDKNMSTNEKQIKMLELAIQHGEDSKVEYNPIDRLVGIHNDIVEHKLFTIEEYAQIVNDSVSNIKKKVELSNLMIEYLAFINAPKQFYIARENKIDGSLNEIYTALKKCKSTEDVETYKTIFFNQLLTQPVNDMTRFIRSIGNDIINKEGEDIFIQEQLDIAETNIEKLEKAKENQNDVKVILSNVRKDTSVSQSLVDSTNKAIEKSKRVRIKNKPLELLSKSIEILNDIDLGVFCKLDTKQKDEIKASLFNIEDKITEIRDILGD